MECVCVCVCVCVSGSGGGGVRFMIFCSDVSKSLHIILVFRSDKVKYSTSLYKAIKEEKMKYQNLFAELYLLICLEFYFS